MELLCFFFYFFFSYFRFCFLFLNYLLEANSNSTNLIGHDGCRWEMTSSPSWRHHENTIRNDSLLSWKTIIFGIKQAGTSIRFFAYFFQFVPFLCIFLIFLLVLFFRNFFSKIFKKLKKGPELNMQKGVSGVSCKYYNFLISVGAFYIFFF